MSITLMMEVVTLKQGVSSLMAELVATGLKAESRQRLRLASVAATVSVLPSRSIHEVANERS